MTRKETIQELSGNQAILEAGFSLSIHRRGLWRAYVIPS